MLRRIVLLVFCLSILAGCSSVRFNQKERLGDRIMIFDYDHVAAELRGHILAPREASLGGFSAGGAGGCGCN